MPTPLKALVVVSLFLIAPLARADDNDFARAVEAHKAGDYQTAFPIFERFAEQGNVAAQISLGDMYYQGKGVVQDYTQAVKWYRRAAEQGVAAAQLQLGVMYRKGQGVPRDFVRAHMWFNLAAAHGYDFAIRGRDRIAEELTREQIAEAQRLAREWMEQHDR